MGGIKWAIGKIKEFFFLIYLIIVIARIRSAAFRYVGTLVTRLMGGWIGHIARKLTRYIYLTSWVQERDAILINTTYGFNCVFSRTCHLCWWSLANDSFLLPFITHQPVEPCRGKNCDSKHHVLSFLYKIKSTLVIIFFLTLFITS